jgi:hypothetical protein
LGTIREKEGDIKTEHKEIGCEDVLICCSSGQELEAGGYKLCFRN